MSGKPSNFNEDLRDERLIEIAHFFKNARKDALDRFDEEWGDDAWLLGCMAYKRTVQKIRTAVETGRYPYLSIHEDVGLKFTFKIGDTLIKFLRGDPDNPKDQKRKISFDDLRQLSFFDILETGQPEAFIWRIIIDAPPGENVSGVVLVALDRGLRVKHAWEIQKERLHPILTDITIPPEDGVELESAMPKQKGARKEQKNAG